jgi:hypothetical protein
VFLYLLLEEQSLLDNIPGNQLAWSDYMRSIQHLVPDLRCEMCNKYPYHLVCPFSCDMVPEESSDDDDNDAEFLIADTDAKECEQTQNLDQYCADPDQDDGCYDSEDLESVERSLNIKRWASGTGDDLFGTYAGSVIEADAQDASLMTSTVILRQRHAFRQDIWRCVTLLHDYKLCYRFDCIRHLVIVAVHHYILCKHVELLALVCDPNTESHSRGWKVFFLTKILEFISDPSNGDIVIEICNIANTIAPNHIFSHLTSWEKKYMQHNAVLWIRSLLDTELLLLPECMFDL